MDRQQHAQGYPNVNARGEIAVTMHRADGAVPRWEIAEGLVPYADAVAQMERDAAAIADRRVAERVWLVEHPPLLTFGTSGKADDVRDARFPVFRSGRGGQVTYHGPGQRVVYVMLDLRDRRQDVRAFVAALEDWIIAMLAEFNVRGERRQDRVGVWVGRPDKGAGYEDKIAAIGIRLRRWVSFHGIAINVEPELANFASIVPCGVIDPRYGVTSLVDLGLPVTIDDVDVALKKTFGAVF